MIGNGIATGYFDQHSGEISVGKKSRRAFWRMFSQIDRKRKTSGFGKVFVFVHKKQI